jgi:tight adherence protein B
VTEAAFYTLTFVLVFLVTSGSAAVAWAVVSRRQGEPRPENPIPQFASSLSPLLRNESLSAFSLHEQVLSRMHFISSLKELQNQANVTWSVGRTSAMMLLAGVVTLNVVMQLDLLPFLASCAVALIGAASPIFYLRRQRSIRYRHIEEQLPEALDYLSRAIVAGNSLPMSMELLADEIGDPLSAELRKTVDEYNLGSPMEEALKALAHRLPMVDVRFFVSAILTQSRTGGNLHDLLDTLAETIRERSTLKAQVRALTANGRLTAIILTLLPVFVAGMMWVVNKNYFMLLAGNPLGKTLIFAAICAQLLAYFIINKIVNIKV